MQSPSSQDGRSESDSAYPLSDSVSFGQYSWEVAELYPAGTGSVDYKIVLVSY